jgi:hypothetical protein
MADFCLQCNRRLFDIDESDFSSTAPADWNQGLARTALCEGCGPIQVGTKGECIGCDIHPKIYPPTHNLTEVPDSGI